jgi:tRNA1Val (adenine37-N6)-methyltransferase
VELGAGSGVISLLLAKRFKDAEINAVEIQESLAECAARNVRLNKLDSRVKIIHKDIRDINTVLAAGTFDCVFTNPPFREAGSGRMSADREKAIARHEIKISLSDIVHAASYLLNNLGRFYMIYHPFRDLSPVQND